MKILKLTVVNIAKSILLGLERKKLIRTLKATDKVLKGRSEKGAVSTIYSSSAANGTHKLICVRVNSTRLKLNSHSDNEEFIIINTGRAKFKPLYIIVGLIKHDALEKKAQSGRLSSDDFICLRMKYNDHRTCIFTMLKGTVHCESTAKGEGGGPVFFVAESSRLKMRRLNIRGYRFLI